MGICYHGTRYCNYKSAVKNTRCILHSAGKKESIVFKDLAFSWLPRCIWYILKFSRCFWSVWFYKQFNIYLPICCYWYITSVCFCVCLVLLFHSIALIQVHSFLTLLLKYFLFISKRLTLLHTAYTSNGDRRLKVCSCNPCCLLTKSCTHRCWLSSANTRIQFGSCFWVVL